MCGLQLSNLLFFFYHVLYKKNHLTHAFRSSCYVLYRLCVLCVCVRGGSGALLHSMWHRFAVFTNATQFLFLTQIVPPCPPVS